MGSIGARLLTNGFARPEGTLGRLGGWLMARGNGPTEKHVVKLARIQPKEHVIVLGPGPGVGLRMAAKYAAIVVGVDPSDTMLRAAKHRSLDFVEAGKVQLISGDAADTHQPDHAASVVLSVNNVQFWPDRPAAYAEILRVMKPNGRLLISVHQKWAPPDLAEELHQAGFSNVTTTTWDPPGRRTPTATIYTATR
jgi:ubiquinone/menaquinone biosynthesis C-methylase UbiE